MAGLYLHIPFCASRCIYCGFYSTTRLDLRQQYVEALCREMEMRSILDDFITEPISTIYLGGGTPSQLTIDQLEQLFIYINKVYSLPSIQGGAGGGSVGFPSPTERTSPAAPSTLASALRAASASSVSAASSNPLVRKPSSTASVSV